MALRRARKCRIIVLLVFTSFVLYVTQQFILVLKIMGYIQNIDNISYFPEQSPEPDVRALTEKAYSLEWVGFKHFPYVPCRKALRRSLVSNNWFPKAGLEKIEDRDFSLETKSCDVFRINHGYERYPPVSQEELDFPLAFIILFHKDFFQVNFLLRAIYRPHNVYCLAVDDKAGSGLKEAAFSVANCLPNVFVASRLERITYKGFSRLKADINCMADLIRYPVDWKYVINMPGQQFPLRTNLEMVKIIKQYNGGNDIEGRTGLRTLPLRYKWEHVEVFNKSLERMIIKRTNKKNPTPPFGLRVVKGSAYNTMSKPFIRFVLTNKNVQRLLKWVEKIESPDEYFWAMVNHNTFFQAPGGYRDPPSSKPHLTVFAIWLHELRCATRFVREICILTPADIPMLKNRMELFANKFYLDHYPSALHCLDQMIFNRTITKYIGNMEFYKDLKIARQTIRRKGIDMVDYSFNSKGVGDGD